jgi:hypothetical protein
MILKKPALGLDPRVETGFPNLDAGQQRRNFALTAQSRASTIKSMREKDR